ncbi:Uncharacterised protein [Vibrio cholerae]|nr:Uncharacterised protein [Vibrio cholerae]CSI76480.1 Uncharacterised protein [Vibrio cholerae]
MSSRHRKPNRIWVKTVVIPTRNRGRGFGHAITKLDVNTNRMEKAANGFIQLSATTRHEIDSSPKQSAQLT